MGGFPVYRSLLVPLDGTPLSVDVVGKAVGLAHALGARITFFHALTGVADSSDGYLGAVRLTARDDLGHAALGRAHEMLSKAEAAARAFGVPCESLCTAATRPAEAIIAAARGQGCDLIFMASHGMRGGPGVPRASDTLSVVMDAGLPVLVSSAAEPDPPARAIAIIRDEHRALAAVLHAWTRQLSLARVNGAAVDAAPMRDIVRYLQSVQATLHHPREERYLFRFLRERTHAVDADLDELERQHARDGVLLAGLDGLVETLERAADGAMRLAATRALEAAVLRYADVQWDHMGREEAAILPAAQRHLTAEDWVLIEDAFGSDPAIRGTSAAALASQHLLERIVAFGDHTPVPVQP